MCEVRLVGWYVCHGSVVGLLRAPWAGIGGSCIGPASVCASMFVGIACARSP